MMRHVILRKPCCLLLRFFVLFFLVKKDTGGVWQRGLRRKHKSLDLQTLHAGYVYPSINVVIEGEAEFSKACVVHVVSDIWSTWLTWTGAMSDKIRHVTRSHSIVHRLDYSSPTRL